MTEVAGTRVDLLVESALLRQQLIVLERQVKRPLYWLLAHPPSFSILLCSIKISLKSQFARRMT